MVVRKGCPPGSRSARTQVWSRVAYARKGQIPDGWGQLVHGSFMRCQRRGHSGKAVERNATCGGVRQGRVPVRSVCLAGPAWGGVVTGVVTGVLSPDGVENLAAGLLAPSAGLGADSAVFVHVGVGLAFVTACLARGRAGFEDGASEVGVVAGVA